MRRLPDSFLKDRMRFTLDEEEKHISVEPTIEHLAWVRKSEYQQINLSLLMEVERELAIELLMPQTIPDL